MAKQIRITCDTSLRIPFRELNGTQGDLKVLSKDNFQKIKSLILKDGFSFALHVWKEHALVNSKEVVKWWLIDGHARTAVIRHMVEVDGFECPPLPCVQIEAVTLKDATRKVLAASSSFHRTTREGLYQFMHGLDMQMADLEEYDLPEINLQSFKLEFFDENIPVENVAAEWAGMPEFQQEDKTGVRDIIVHFKSVSDVKAFAELIEQNISEKTKSIWFPKVINDSYTDEQYVSEES